MLGDEGATPRCPHPALPRSGRTESPARWALPSSQRAPGARARPAFRSLRPLRSLRPHQPRRGPPPLARPVARGPASGPLPPSHWPARGPRRCLSRLSRRPLAIPDPPRKFEKKKKVLWADGRGRGSAGEGKGREERRLAAERGGGGGGGIPAPLSPAREPFPPSCLLLSPPLGADMTVSAPPAAGGAALLHPQAGRRATARAGAAPLPSGQPPPHFPEARRGLGRKKGDPGCTGRLSCLTFSRPHLSEPGASATPTQRRWELSLSGTTP